MPTKRRCQVKTTAAAALASAAAANTTGAAPRRPSDPLVVPVSGEIDALLLDHQRPLVHLRADRPAIDDFHSASRHSRLSASIGSLGARQEPRKPNPPGFDDYTWEPRPDPLPRPSKLEHDGQQKVRRHRRPHERAEA